MNRWLRDFRLIPIVLLAVSALFVLKSTGLVFDGGFTLGQRLAKSGAPTMVVTTVTASPSIAMVSPSLPLDVSADGQPPRKVSWMREMFNYPDVTGSIKGTSESARDAGLVTGSAAAAPKADKPETAPPKPAEPKAQTPGTQVPLDQPSTVSAAERAILERLQERRQELDARAREFELRETLLKAAEKKLDARNNDLKAQEVRLKAGTKRDEAESARYKNIVTMYENMKPKDAAKIFDRLDMKILIEVANTMAPRRMSEILAQMSPENAEKLTVELAARSSEKASSNADLPKIEGKPTGS